MTGMLDGIKVVSFTHYLQGPSCSQMLGDLGADVVRIEPIGGSYERFWSGARTFVGDESVFFLLAGRNQRSAEINLRSPEGEQVLWRMIDAADVIVENFRPGVLERRGFGYEAVAARNPGIVYCSLTGFGPTGPLADQPGQDLLIQSFSGLAALSGRAGDPPVLMGSAIVDEHSAALGALGIVAALVRRARTGEGAKVDGNLLSAALDLQLEPLNCHLNGGRLWDRSASGISSRFHQAPYGVFQTSDGWLTLSLADGATLATAFDDDRFSAFSRDDQFEQREQINEMVAAHMRTRPTAHWRAHLSEVGVWNAPVNEYDDLLPDPQLAANESVLTFEHPAAGTVRVVNHPVKYDGHTPALRRVPPTVGQHTGEVLHDLGYADDEIERMRAAGAIGPDRAVVGFDRKASEPASAYSAKR
ncbi:CaiB/BaiF CoA-transferase family protein [Microbacterium kribbense]|uniref:CaiB/BaiF CoA-transferase family protein n=1 Tax=Microbacterium kribbense TaxID=433645 RepID=A0ABP7GTT3_9MICO